MLNRQMGAVARDLGRTSLQAFCRIYLSHHFGLPPCRMHLEVGKLLESAARARDARICVAAPRGYAKTSLVSLGYVLGCLCYRKENYIALVSNTADQAVDLLTTVKEELRGNALLIRDFPDVAEPPHSRPPPKRWRRDEVITRSNAKIIALGAGQKIRGRKHAQHRPTLIILDDVENEAEVTSADVRSSRLEWFEKAVLKAGATGQTNVVVVGTLLHFDSLLMRLIEGKLSPGWSAHRYQAVEGWSERPDLWQTFEKVYTHQADHEGDSGPDAAKALYACHEAEMLRGTKVLWPESETYLQLMVMRLTEGQASFDSEKQNNPVDPSTCYFDTSSLTYWDDQYSSIEALRAAIGGEMKFFGACDPSLGKAGKNGDYSAIITVALHEPTKHIYVIDAEVRRCKPAELIELIIGYQRIRHYRQFVIETNQFQDFLADEVKRRSTLAGVSIPVSKVNHTTDKLGRIQSLQPKIASGILRFSRRHRLLLDQARQFPRGAHDDALDALAMAVEACRRSGTSGVFRLTGA